MWQASWIGPVILNRGVKCRRASQVRAVLRLTPRGRHSRSACPSVITLRLFCEFLQRIDVLIGSVVDFYSVRAISSPQPKATRARPQHRSIKYRSRNSDCFIARLWVS